LGRRFPRDTILRGDFTLGDLPEFLNKIICICFNFLYVDPILGVEKLRVIVRDKFLTGLNCLDYRFAEMRIFLWRNLELDFLAFKKTV